MGTAIVSERVAKPLFLALGIAIVVLAGAPSGYSQTAPLLPYMAAHLSPSDGVLRDPSVARGDCRQCHISHAEDQPQVRNLFAPNDNMLCFSASGVEGCHINRPSGASAGYPAQEQDRFPDQHLYHGYFEANVGGVKTPGLNDRVRWPGRTIWENLSFSKHYSSPNMPRLDGTGHGSCLNCHDAHNGASPYDQLVKQYGPIAGSTTNAAPTQYNLCFSCHGSTGPGSLPPSSRSIANYYSRSVTGSTRAGHAIVTTRGAVKAGDRLPCYDCHNEHGSVGSDGQNPNGFLISDQRPGWYGLTDIRNNAAQARRFCNGCHAFSDQTTPSIPVEGITAEKLPDHEGHRSTDIQHCMDQHGRDYSSPTGHNVHNPNGG